MINEVKLLNTIDEINRETKRTNSEIKQIKEELIRYQRINEKLEKLIDIKLEEYNKK